MKPKRKLWVNRRENYPHDVFLRDENDDALIVLCRRLFTRYVGPLKPGETRELIVKLGKRKRT
jgi:hypothetical protein